MWEGKKGTPEKATPEKRNESLIGVGTNISGDIAFSGELRIDGTVKGNINATEGQTAMLVVSEQAKVEGDVHVSHVVINGAVQGQITVDEHIELQPKARVVGDVSYKTLEMHIGAIVQGRLNHVEPGAASVVEFKRGTSAEDASKSAAGAAPAR